MKFIKNNLVILTISTGAKHFSGAIEGEDACLELPEVVESVGKLSVA